MTRIERTRDKYNRAFVKELLRAAGTPPEKLFASAKEVLEYLEEDDPRKPSGGTHDPD